LEKQRLTVHATNINGFGAVQLLHSLLPSLLSRSEFITAEVWLPNSGSPIDNINSNNHAVIKRYQRSLPNALSRVLECTLFAYRFDRESPILVLGDLPLRCLCRQVLFVQTSFIVPPRSIFTWLIRFKYVISRSIFRFNSKYVDAFIVQTEVMRAALETAYPRIKDLIHVIPQPVPNWLLFSGLKRNSRVSDADINLNLIYPAAGYPHKNHQLLSNIDPDSNWPIEKLQITLDQLSSPAPNLPWLLCRGFLSPQEMVDAYSHVDALLFLSKEESYGFPLVEAMYVGLPIICPNLPYAHFLCGDQAIYFDPDSVESLRAAVGLLKSRFEDGWWPNWDEQMKCIPKDWDTVAKRMMQIAVDQNLQD
jgi:glycosyltransferase involved in cell wall biosynthesis